MRRKSKALKSNKKYTEKEIEKIRTLAGTLTAQQIARDMNRPIWGIYSVASKHGFSLKMETGDEYLSPTKIAKRVGIDRTTIIKYINSGDIEVEKIKKGARSEYRISPENLHIFINSNFSFSYFNCWICLEKVKGSIFCKDCIPDELRNRKPLKTVFKTKVTKDINKDISEIMEYIRVENMKISRSEAARRAGYDQAHISKIEKNKVKWLCLDVIQSILEAYGYESELIIRKKM